MPGLFGSDENQNPSPFAMSGPIDPRLAQRFRLAQMLQNQGTQTTPLRTPAEGLARLAQGIFGTILGDKANDEFQNRQQGMRDTLAQAMGQFNNPSGDPMANLQTGYQTLSSNPYLAPMAAQGAMTMAANKAMARANLANEMFGKGQIMGTDANGNPQVSPVPGFGTTEAANAAPKAGAVTGATKAAELPFIGPAAAATKAAELPFAGPTAAAVAQAELPSKIAASQASPQVIPPQGQLIIPSPGHGPQPPSPQAPSASGVQPAIIPGNNPSGNAGVKGTVGPNGSQVFQNLQGLPEAVKPMVEGDYKDVQAARDAADKAEPNLATLQTIQDFLPKVQTGWSGETRLEGARILTALGVDPKQVQSFIGTDPSSGQLLNKNFLTLSANAVRGMGAREPGSVISMFRNAYPGLGTDPKAITLQTNALKMDALRQRDYANALGQHYEDSVNGVQQGQPYKGLTDFKKQFQNTNDPRLYLKAAQAISGAPETGWDSMKSDQQEKIYNLIPSGSSYLAPDGQMHVKGQ